MFLSVFHAIHSDLWITLIFILLDVISFIKNILTLQSDWKWIHRICFMQKKYGKHRFMLMKCSPTSSSKALPYLLLYNLKRFSLNATLVHYYFFPTRVFTLEYLCFLVLIYTSQPFTLYEWPASNFSLQ